MAPSASAPSNGSGEVSSVRVVARFRPPVSDAEREEDRPAFTVEPGGAVESADLMHRFQFDRAFGQGSSQSEVYEDVGRPIVDDVLSGYNGTILAYGPTGSGKTFCMFGPHSRSFLDLEGLVPRAVQQVLDHAAVSHGEDGELLTVECSFYEVYCEQVRDFLRPKLQNLQLKEMPGGGFSVEGLTHQKINTSAEALQILRTGLKLRVAANTKLNQHSSRSHAIFSLVLRQMESQGIRQRKLTLVDLAGSEKVRKSGSVGGMLEEAKKINSSLSTLGHVIEALADRRPHVPYRDSRLTRLLEDSLGGNCRTTLLVACSPSCVHSSETLSSLRFAARAKKVENCARINVNCTPQASYASSDRQLRQRIAQLRRELARLEGRRLSQEYVPGRAPTAVAAQQHGEDFASSAPTRSRAVSASAATRGASPVSRSSRASPARSLCSPGTRSPMTPRPLHRSTEDISKGAEASDRRQPGIVNSASASSFNSMTDRASASDKTLATDTKSTGEKKVQAAVAAAIEAQRYRQDMPEAIPIGSGVTLLGSCKSTATGSAASSTGSAAGFSLTGSASGTPLSHYRDPPHRDESPLGPSLAARRSSYSFLIEATPLTDHTGKGSKTHRPPLMPTLSAPGTIFQVPKPTAEEESEQAHRVELESQRQVAAQLSARCAQLSAELALERERHAKDAKEMQTLHKQVQEAQSAWLPSSPSRGRLASCATRLATMSQSHSLAHALGSSSSSCLSGSLSPSRRLVRYSAPLSLQAQAQLSQQSLSQQSLSQPSLSQPLSSRATLLTSWHGATGAAPVATIVTESVCRTPSSMAVPSRTPSSSPVRMKVISSAARWPASPSPRHQAAAAASMPVAEAMGMGSCTARARSGSQPGRRLSLASPRALSPSLDSLPRASVVSTCPSLAMPATASAAVAAATGSSASYWPPGLLGERWSPRRMPSASPTSSAGPSPSRARARPTADCYTAASEEVREALSKLRL